MLIYLDYDCLTSCCDDDAYAVANHEKGIPCSEVVQYTWVDDGYFGCHGMSQAVDWNYKCCWSCQDA